ncbi:ACP S-malonyltransferase [Brachybacterium sp. AOP25-B2-12]|uniref:ACP S-malonyltransferase n=1 Tax=Brachybacterium sp. AOP25-B2-12 TaxID=3457710 RepID=UPI00403458DF
MLVIVSPGQGAQKPGFLSPWLERPGVPERLAELSEAAGLDLALHGTQSDADTIRDTAVAQPLLVAAGILAHEALASEVEGPTADLLAGHSVGEVTTTALAGVLSATEAMRLVAVRARAMAEAAAVEPTSMAAVVGGDRTEVLAAIAAHGLTPANLNSAAQVVAAGAVDAVAALVAEPPTRARVIPLQVAGAFHTRYMAPARNALAAVAAELTPADPRVPLVTNADGRLVTSGAEYLDLLVAQVASPVDWAACMATFRDQGVTALIEVAPAGTLTGLAKRELKGIELVGLSTPEDLDAARDLVARHRGAAPAPAAA